MRLTANPRGARLTLSTYFISACVRALRAHPEVNANFTKMRWKRAQS
jgi:pyruvate/2-oxoglutarate dehydrogenase complex dihydrolipoamide acyltransferase (E2) component